MWIAEGLLILGFFVIGTARPTPRSDAVAKKRGLEESNRSRTERIRRAEDDYRSQNPQLERTYRVAITIFFIGVGMVLLFDIHSAGETLFSSLSAIVALGYVVQVIALVTFSVCALRKRRYIVHAIAEGDREGGSA
jgi:hypothetical protein